MHTTLIATALAPTLFTSAHAEVATYNVDPTHIPSAVKLTIQVEAVKQ